MQEQRVLTPHSRLCAFYVFNQTEPCDCQGGGPDDPKTAALLKARDPKAQSDNTPVAR